MTDHVMPILYVNMAGEMMYILDQRLKVTRDFQGDDERTKADKVLKDIIQVVLGKTTLTELFKMRGIPPKKSLKLLFERLAHTSIMRLNDNSMDKLFDLMVMAVKYAFVKVTMAEQIMTVTVNHLQGIQDILPGDEEIRATIDHAFTMLVSLYRPMNPLSWHIIRSTVLQYFQHVRIKISMLLRENRQLADGRFVLFREAKPIELASSEMDGVPIGTIHYYEDGVRVAEKDEKFDVKFQYVPCKALPDALNVRERSTNLGDNWYKTAGSMKIDGGGGTAKIESTFKAANEMAFLESIMSRDTSANGELDAKIMGMSLFDDPTEEKNYVKESEQWYGRVATIDVAKNRKSLKSTIEEKTKSRATSAERPATSKKKSRGAAMLELMDEAAARPPTAKPGRRSESTDVAKPKSRAGSRTRAPSATPKRAQSAKKKAAN